MKANKTQKKGMRDEQIYVLVFTLMLLVLLRYVRIYRILSRKFRCFNHFIYY